MFDMAVDTVCQIVMLKQVFEVEVCFVGQQEQNP